MTEKVIGLVIFVAFVGWVYREKIKLLFKKG